MPAKKPAAKKAAQKPPAAKKPQAARTTTPKAPVAVAAVATPPKPTSATPVGSGKTSTAAKVATKVGLKVAKAKHAIAITKTQKINAKRQLVVAFAKWGIANADQIHYAQIRPITRVKVGKLPALPWTTDCSGFVTTAYESAGLLDPNKRSYDGEGNTETLQTGTKTTSPKPGDIGVFGTGYGHHALIALAAAADPECGSHGSEVGPLEILASVEQRYQPEPLTWFNLEARIP